MDKSLFAALAVSLPLMGVPALAQAAEAVIVEPPSKTVVVKPEPKPTVVVTPDRKKDCETTVVKKEGVVRDTTTVKKEC